MKPNIVVVGSSNTDMIIRLAHVPKPGETILGGRFTTAAGGKGANQAIGAARAGGKVVFVAQVGDDSFGTEAVAGLASAGVGVDHVFRERKHPSGVALICVGKDGANSIAVAPGANGQLRPTHVKRAEPAIARARYLLVQLEIPRRTVRAAIELAHAHGVPVILNPAPAQPLPASLLRRVSILTPNEGEAELLTGLKVKDAAGATRAAEALRARGVGTVIITLGAQGALLVSQGVRQLVPGFRVKPLDTTGAGDIFNGALAVALGEGQALPAAMRFANAAAALSVTRLGTQPSAPTRREIDRFLRRHRR